MNRTLPALLLTVCLLTHTSYRPVPPSRHFHIEHLSDGVWVAINNDAYGHAICNAGIVDMGDRTLVFDPFMNLDAAQDLKAVAKELTHREASIIVDSHYHNDHIRGNQLFPDATIISSEWTKNEMAVSEPEELKWEKENAPKLLEAYKKKMITATGREKEELPLWIGYFEGMVVNDPKVVTRLPNLTFRDSLWLYGKKNNIRLVECRNGHTGSDVVLEIPSAGIVFMGDLLFQKRHPYLGDGRWDSWIGHLQSFYKDEGFHTFLPGHGELSGKAEVKKMIDYIQDVHDLVQTDISKGESDSLILKSPVPAAYTDWKFGQFYSSNLNLFCHLLRPAGTGTH